MVVWVVVVVVVVFLVVFVVLLEMVEVFVIVVVLMVVGLENKTHGRLNEFSFVLLPCLPSGRNNPSGWDID